MTNQDWTNLPQQGHQRPGAEQQMRAQEPIQPARGFGWWSWIWLLAVIVVFLWLLGWGW